MTARRYRRQSARGSWSRALVCGGGSQAGALSELALSGGWPSGYGVLGAGQRLALEGAAAPSW
jgi:hypothetical protein